MYQAAASCKDIIRASVTNWDLQCLTLAEYCYAVRQGMKVQLVTPYRVSLWQRYGATVRGNKCVPNLRHRHLHKGRPTVSYKGPQTLLWAGSRTLSVRIAF